MSGKWPTCNIFGKMPPNSFRQSDFSRKKYSFSGKCHRPANVSAITWREGERSVDVDNFRFARPWRQAVKASPKLVRCPFAPMWHPVRRVRIVIDAPEFRGFFSGKTVRAVYSKSYIPFLVYGAVLPLYIYIISGPEFQLPSLPGSAGSKNPHPTSQCMSTRYTLEWTEFATLTGEFELAVPQ